MAKMGRPAKQIDWDFIKNEALVGGSKIGMAQKLGVDQKTLEKACLRDHKVTLSEFIQLKHAVGKNMLRVKQFQLAMEGSERMNIWLGKQWLDQSDKIENKVDAQVESTNKVQLTPEQIVEVLNKVKK